MQDDLHLLTLNVLHLEEPACDGNVGSTQIDRLNFKEENETLLFIFSGLIKFIFCLFFSFYFQQLSLF